MSKKCWMCRRDEREVRMDYDDEDYGLKDTYGVISGGLDKPISQVADGAIIDGNVCIWCRSLVYKLFIQCNEFSDAIFNMQEEHNVRKINKSQHLTQEFMTDFKSALDLMKRRESI